MVAVMQPLRALRAVKPAEANGTPPLSPERMALAEAIAGVTELHALLHATQIASDAAQPAVWAAVEALEAAPDLVERATANAAIYLQQQARGLAPESPQTIREARKALADAKDDLDAARAVRSALEAESVSIQARLPMAEEHVRRAARAVLHAEVEGTACALAAELAAMQRTMVALGDTVEWLAGAGAFSVVEQHGGNYGKPADEAVRMALYRMQSPPHSWNGLAIAQPSPAAVWVAAFATLQADAMAPLPVVPTP